jgi:hypothetical protein
MVRRLPNLDPLDAVPIEQSKSRHIVRGLGKYALRRHRTGLAPAIDLTPIRTVDPPLENRVYVGGVPEHRATGDVDGRPRVADDLGETYLRIDAGEKRCQCGDRIRSHVQERPAAERGIVSESGTLERRNSEPACDGVHPADTVRTEQRAQRVELRVIQVHEPFGNRESARPRTGQ